MGVILGDLGKFQKFYRTSFYHPESLLKLPTWMCGCLPELSLCTTPGDTLDITVHADGGARASLYWEGVMAPLAKRGGWGRFQARLLHPCLLIT